MAHVGKLCSIRREAPRGEQANVLLKIIKRAPSVNQLLDSGRHGTKISVEQHQGVHCLTLRKLVCVFRGESHQSVDHFGVHHSPMASYWLASQHFEQTLNCEFPDEFRIVSQVSPEQLRLCFCRRLEFAEENNRAGIQFARSFGAWKSLLNPCRHTGMERRVLCAVPRIQDMLDV